MIKFCPIIVKWMNKDSIDCWSFANVVALIQGKTVLTCIIHFMWMLKRGRFRLNITINIHRSLCLLNLTAKMVDGVGERKLRKNASMSYTEEK